MLRIMSTIFLTVWVVALATRIWCLCGECGFIYLPESHDSDQRGEAQAQTIAHNRGYEKDRLGGATGSSQ